MKVITWVILFGILVFNQGCCSKTQTFRFSCVDECVPDTIIIKETKLIRQDIPVIPIKTKPNSYKVFAIKIDNQQFYAVTKAGAAKMSTNIESEKSYIKLLIELLNSLREPSEK